MTRSLAENPVAPAGAPRLQIRWWWALVLAGVVVVLFGVVRLVETSPKTVPRVTFVNNSAYDIGASVTGGAPNDKMELGTVKAHSSTDINEVIDQGSTWVFDFTGPFGDGGEVTVARANLANGQWRVVIPDAVIQRIAAGESMPTTTTTNAP